MDRGTLNGSEADETERHLVRERCDGLGDIDCLRQYTETAGACSGMVYDSMRTRVAAPPSAKVVPCRAPTDVCTATAHE
jgi:hypothetical protein